MIPLNLQGGLLIAVINSLCAKTDTAIVVGFLYN